LPGPSALAMLREVSRFRVLALTLLAACSSYDPCEEEPAACACAEARRLDDGTCCFGFTRPDDGVCSARTWTRPNVADAWGEAGAREVGVVVDSEGHGVASWVAQDDGIVLAEEIDGAWMLQRPGVGSGPSLAAGPEREVWLAWTQSVDASAAVLASMRRDGAWMHARAEDPLATAGTDPQPVVTAWGEALVVWTQSDGVALARRSPEDGVLVRLPTSLSPAIASPSAAHLAVAPNGDAIVAWQQAATEGSDAMVFASERARIDGEFTRPSADAFLSPPGAPASDVVVAIGARGHAAVVWRQGRDGVAPLYLATRDGLQEWTLPQGLDRPFSVARGEATDARVVFGRDTELYVIWSQHVDDRPQVWAAHRDELGAWDDSGLAPALLSSPDHDAASPSIAAGPHGETIAVWAERADGSPWRIATRRRNAGATKWSELDVLSPDDGSDANDPAVAIGSTGRAVVAWAQGPADATTIRFATMD
jgi:hypothetical protein